MFLHAHWVVCVMHTVHLHLSMINQALAVRLEEVLETSSCLQVLRMALGRTTTDSLSVAPETWEPPSRAMADASYHVIHIDCMLCIDGDGDQHILSLVEQIYFL